MKFAVCLFCAYVGISSVVWAETDANKGVRELADVQAKIRRLGGDVKKLASRKAEQMGELRRLEKEYGEQVNVLNEVKVEMEQQEQMLRDVRSKIDTTRRRLHAQRRSLEGLVKSAYIAGDKRGLDVMLNQRDPAMSGRLLIYYDYISKARVRKLQLIEEDVQALKRLESQKDTETQLLQVTLEKKQQEANALKELKVQRETLVARLNKEYASKRSQLANLIQDEKKLEALVASLQHANENLAPPSPSESPAKVEPVVSTSQAKSFSKEKRQSIRTGKAFAELQGKLPWPVSGAIVERFGSKRFETRWDGAVIGAKEGAAIHAVADGRVVFADWLRGYGLMTIVDHGKGYMSLYAFNQSLHKKVGEYVRAGERLASVGRSGGRSSASLYFGIRIKGRPVDPEKWCRKLGKG